MYLPYAWLVFTEWQYLKLWPIFPGVAPCFLAQGLLRLEFLRRAPLVWSGAATVGLLILLAWGLSEARRSFWPLVGVGGAVSCALSVMGWLMLKA